MGDRIVGTAITILACIWCVGVCWLVVEKSKHRQRKRRSRNSEQIQAGIIHMPEEEVKVYREAQEPPMDVNSTACPRERRNCDRRGPCQC